MYQESRGIAILILMITRVIALLLLFVLSSAPVFAATQTSAAQAAAASVNYHYMRLFYYREGANAKKSLYAHASSVDIFAPQVYKINDDGSLSGTLSADVLAFAKAHKLKIMPLVTNGGFSRAASEAFLGDPQKEAVAIQAMIAEAKDRGYWGWQIDFEQMDASARPLFSAFVQKAYAAFKGKGLTLSVAVISKVSDNPADYKDGLWENLIGVYDYTALAASSDFITLMSYDDPESKGPVAPMPWYERVFTYALAHIPNNKISLGLPLYYWQWNDATQKLIGIGGAEGLNNALTKHPSAKITFDATQQTPVIKYTISGVPYSIWYENAKSVAAKVALVKQNRLYGVSAWTLGLELAERVITARW